MLGILIRNSRLALTSKRYQPFSKCVQLFKLNNNMQQRSIASFFKAPAATNGTATNGNNPAAAAARAQPLSTMTKKDEDDNQKETEAGKRTREEEDKVKVAEKTPKKEAVVLKRLRRVEDSSSDEEEHADVKMEEAPPPKKQQEEKEQPKVQEKEKEPVKAAPKAKPAPEKTKSETASSSIIAAAAARPKSPPKAKPAGNSMSSFFTKASSSSSSSQQDEPLPPLDLSAKFDPITSACWKKGEKVPFLHLARYFEKIEAESKRLVITELLSRCFQSVIALSEKDLLYCVYLSVNELGAPHEGLEVGVGEAILTKALADATGRQLAQLKAEIKETGDIGIVAKNSRSNQKTLFKSKPLTVEHVFTQLKAIAMEQGQAATKRRGERIKGLLVASQEAEAVYIARFLQGRLRIGCNQSTVLTALAHAITLCPPERVAAAFPSQKKPDDEALEQAAATIKSVHSELPCYDMIIPRLLEFPIAQLPTYCYLTPGVPVKPMLAHPTKSISEVLDRIGSNPFICEFKYDGERAQIHLLEDKSIRIFSRNSDETSGKYPDIMQLLPKILKPEVKSCILDCESVAFDEAKGILPFQVLSTRARKTVNIEDIKVQVCLFFFDILFLNGEPLIKKPLHERRQILAQCITPIEGKAALASNKECSDPEEIQKYLEVAVAGNCEGLMVKIMDGEGSTYEPDKRSHKWLKVKKDYIHGMGDSLDLVPIAAYHGRGKRTGTYGAFLLACYNPENEVYQTITKIGTGFKDEDLQTFTQQLQPYVIEGPRPYYQWTDVPQLRPDVWLEAQVVWEVSAADLSISPVHTAAKGDVDSNKGIALRFPRLVRVRDDKKAEDATTAEQVANMYQKQAINHHAKKNDGSDED